MRVRAGRDLPHTGPPGSQAVPDPTEGPGGREMTVPGSLRACERTSIAELPPQVEGIERRDRKHRRKAPRPAARNEREGRQQCDTDRPCQDRQPGSDTRFRQAPAFGERERCETEKEEERLGVDGLQEESHGKEREVEHRAPRAGRTEPLLGDAFEQHKRAECRHERDDDSSEDVVPAERAAEHADDRGIERVERSLRSGVAVFRDAQEVHGVPAGPDVGDRAEVVRQRRVVPAPDTRVAQRLQR